MDSIRFVICKRSMVHGHELHTYRRSSGAIQPITERCNWEDAVLLETVEAAQLVEVLNREIAERGVMYYAQMVRVIGDHDSK